MVKYFKLGQTVDCALYGKGVVVSVNDYNKPDWPIQVRFESSVGMLRSYTKEGRPYKCIRGILYTKVRVTLSTKEIPLIVNEPIPEFDLSFKEIFDALFIEHKTVQCELYSDLQFCVKEKILYTKTISMSGIYENNKCFTKEELTSKWKIVD